MPSDAAVSSLSPGSLSPGSLSSGSGPPGSPPGASYLRSLRPEEAIAAKDSIDIFFGKATQSKDQKSPPATPTDPLKAYWVLTIGGCFVVASVITIALRAKLPDGTPGIYLGVFGALLLALGGVYLWQSWETKRPPGASGPAPVEHATKLIKKQIDYVMGDAGAAFGPMHAEGYRKPVLGIGKKDWIAPASIVLKEWNGHTIYASLVHIVVVDLTPAFLTIRQYGLDLTTGTICDQRSVRRPISEVLSASRRSKRVADSAGWERASELANQLKEARKRAPKDGQRGVELIARLEQELKKITFDKTASEEFVIDFSGGDQVLVTVATEGESSGSRRAAYPIGGADNLNDAIATWARIDAARADDVARRQGHREDLLASMKGTNSGIMSMGSTLGRVEQGFSGLQETMLLRTQPVPAMSRTGSANSDGASTPGTFDAAYKGPAGPRLG